MSEIKKLKETFTPQVIQYYKDNQSQITAELLSALRSQGNEGKKLALDILETPKSQNGYYLDSFGERISNNGNRGIKSKNTSLALAQIHLDEIAKCQNIFYFLENYVKLVTKSGVDFPELREYQTSFIEKIIQDSNTDLVSLAPRQCCSADTELNILDVKNSKIKQLTFEDLFNECKNEYKGLK